MSDDEPQRDDEPGLDEVAGAAPPAPSAEPARLGAVQARIIGSLLEKERTTPDQYPLTMNALVLACNQATSREPMMHLAEHEVQAAITELKAAGLARLVHPMHGRSVTRFRQVADEKWQLDVPAAALVAVMLLRGPQTVSELRTRTERQHRFESFEAIERELAALAARGLVRLLERQPGQKEPRWQQLLADEPAPSASSASWSGGSGSSASRHTSSPDPALVERIAELEARVAKLESALADLL